MISCLGRYIYFYYDVSKRNVKIINILVICFIIYGDYGIILCLNNIIQYFYTFK